MNKKNDIIIPENYGIVHIIILLISYEQGIFHRSILKEIIIEKV